MGTSEGTRRASARANALAGLALVIAICLFDATSAVAAASYVFEPTLSLTGNCKTSPLDEVPDPGLCPIPPGTVFSGSPGADHPSAAFKSPSITTDEYGDIYVASVNDKESRIDVFSAQGFFITEVPDPAGVQSIAVDAKGNVYLFERIAGGERQIRRLPPKIYKPEEEEIEYGEEPVVLTNSSTKKVLSMGPETSLDVDRATGRVYVDNGTGVAVFGSASEENKLLEPEAIGNLERSTSIAIDGEHGKIYLSERHGLSSIVRIFELKPPHKEVGQIDGSTTPAKQFLSNEGFIALDVDERSGHVFVGDFTAEKVYELNEDGTYLETIEHSFVRVPLAEIAIDDGKLSPHPQKEGWLFVPSVPAPSNGHVYAFEPKEQGPPVVETTSVGGVTDTEATLHARINPEGLPTEYRLEYITQQQWEEEGNSFANAAVAGEGTLPKGAEGINVSSPAFSLEPETAYRFRAFAENEEGNDEEEGSFKTFPAEGQPPTCENETFRIGPSALLPDCRAYELVTPSDTNGRPPTGGFAGIYFPVPQVSPDGSRASFLIEGGTLPGYEGTGVADLYLAARGEKGWITSLAGPRSEEAIGPLPGSASPDQAYSFWSDGSGVHIHYPDGHSELVGKGSLGEDPIVSAELITEGAAHIFFETKGGSAVQLEPNAPPAKTSAVYDRSAEGPTHVVSLLPGDEPQKAGENALYLGASEDGEGIAFKIGGTIYVRLHNTETLEVAGPGSTFAGISEEGGRVFYLEGGDLFAFDTETKTAIPFSGSGDVTVVNIATGGTRAYFVSPSVLTTEPNPEGEKAEPGKENLYLSEEGQISFVGSVTKRDVEGESTPEGQIGGLGLWLSALTVNAPASDPSRTTPSGTSFLFESRADLGGFESEGFAQVYRYDSAQARLTCLSCSPTSRPPTGDASLQSIGEIAGNHLKVANQTPDGRRAFFQTAEPLVGSDTDGKLDVYEWEEYEVGTCERPGGCIYLISGGHSSSPDLLFAMSKDGNDVFFRTADLLLPRDTESTLSLYDARVEGGFAESKICVEEVCCDGENCRPLGSTPELPQPATTIVGPDGNVPPRKPGKCPKGKHKHGGKCIKGHKKHHRGTGTKKRGGSR